MAARPGPPTTKGKARCSASAGACRVLAGQRLSARVRAENARTGTSGARAGVYSFGRRLGPEKPLYGRFCRGKRHPRRWPRGGYALYCPHGGAADHRGSIVSVADWGASMANHEHVALLKQGVAAWNAWRDENPQADVDLSGSDLHAANLSGANLRKANLNEANLIGANLSEANLTQARLIRANLLLTNLERANVMGAMLLMTTFSAANLSGANLSGADLSFATLAYSNLTLADLTDCRIHGVSAWGLKLEGAQQQNLVITRADEPEITVDNIEVAQFIYLMLHNQKIRDVIDTITSKAVLILGRFEFTRPRGSVPSAGRSGDHPSHIG